MSENDTVNKILSKVLPPTNAAW